MNRIQFFYDDDLIALELKINDWLSANKDIKIIETSLGCLGKPSLRAGITNTEKHVFYILYITANWENIIMEKKAEESISSVEQLETKMGANLPN